MNKGRRPSFFKVLINYTTKLSLPPVFVRNFGKYLPATVKLGSISGETWNVKLGEEISDEGGLCFLGRGWTKFVKDLELKYGEFLVFFLNVGEGESTFDVTVYGTNFCERRMNHVDYSDSIDFELKNDYHNDPGAAAIERPHFEGVLTERRTWTWGVPKRFLEAANLTGKRSVVLEYLPKKRYGAVLLVVQRNSRVLMSTGWNEFRLENGLVTGKTYSFEFNPTTNVIEVKEHK